MNSLPVSFAHLRIVTEDMLAERLESVKILAEAANEAYMIEKDTETGDHYLHYAVRHLNIAAGGAEEHFHHLMPLEHDDVISFALGSTDYIYPENWEKPYLRNGPNGGFVWYDPAGAAEDAVPYDAIAGEIRARLEAFRQQGRGGEQDVQRLMDEMERLFDPKKSNSKPSDQGPSPD